MLPTKKVHSKEKPKLHPRNRHRERYDFDLLKNACPDLAQFVQENIHGDESIDFANPEAVKMLNRALLVSYYGLTFWDIPTGFLTPPIPGRADYIHHIADLLCSYNYGKIPTGPTVRCLDIGTGANCIYPIIGHYEYGWSFIGSDIDPVSIKSANEIIARNEVLKGAVEVRFQPNWKDIFYGILNKDEIVDLVICNPPFHSSLEEAQAANLRKVNNLNLEKTTGPTLNFGGQGGELWCIGGEEKFVKEMIRQSRHFSKNCFWFSSLISKQTNLKPAYEALKMAGAFEVKTIPMGQGQKTSRLLAWTFLKKEEQKTWRNERWNAKPPARP